MFRPKLCHLQARKHLLEHIEENRKRELYIYIYNKVYYFLSIIKLFTIPNKTCRQLRHAVCSVQYDPQQDMSPTQTCSMFCPIRSPTRHVANSDMQYVLPNTIPNKTCRQLRHAVCSAQYYPQQDMSPTQTCSMFCPIKQIRLISIYVSLC
jgi:hypothetical protein